MKKLSFILAALAMVGVACNKQEVIENNENPEEKADGMVRIELKVSIDPETRATMDNKVLKFGADDKIAILATVNNTTEVKTLTVESIDSESGVITFTTDVAANAEIGEYAYYPSDLIVPDGDDIDPTRILWPSRVYTSEGVKLPMMAKIDLENKEAVFKHLGAMLKVTVANAPAYDWLEFKTSGTFSGYYTVNPSDWSISPITNNPPAEPVNYEYIQSLGNDTYYIPIPAGTYGDFQLGMMLADNQGTPTTYIKQRTAALESAITPARGQIVNLGTFTYDVDEIAEWYLVCEMNSWDSSKKNMRFTKIGSDTYRISGYAPKGSADAYYYFFWNGSTQYGVNNSISGDLASGQTCKRTNNEIFTSTITWNSTGSKWTLSDKYYSNDWYGCFTNGAHNVVFKTDIDNWGSGVNLSKPDGGNYTNDMIWSGTVTISDNGMHYFKVLAYNTDTNADVWYGGDKNVTIVDSKPYGTAWWSNGENIPFVLTPGDYTFYFNIRELDFMFVRQ